MYMQMIIYFHKAKCLIYSFLYATLEKSRKVYVLFAHFSLYCAVHDRPVSNVDMYYTESDASLTDSSTPTTDDDHTSLYCQKMFLTFILSLLLNHI